MTTKPVAGARIKAANTPAPYLLSAACSAPLTVTTTTAADIAGCTLTFTTVNTNVSVLVIGAFDISVVTAGTSVAIANCLVDGAAQSGQATQQLITTGIRGTVAQVWNVTLATAASHTIKFQGALTAASGSASFGATHTTITLMVLDW